MVGLFQTPAYTEEPGRMLQVLETISQQACRYPGTHPRAGCHEERVGGSSTAGHRSREGSGPPQDGPPRGPGEGAPGHEPSRRELYRLDGLPLVHSEVAVGHAVEAHGAVEHAARMDPALPPPRRLKDVQQTPRSFIDSLTVPAASPGRPPTPANASGAPATAPPGPGSTRGRREPDAIRLGGLAELTDPGGPGQAWPLPEMPRTWPIRPPSGSASSPGLPEPPPS